MSPRTDRAGVIGPSGIGRVHIDALRRIGVHVAAVAGTDPLRARDLAEELRIPRVYEDGFELCEGEDIDVVHVCTPNAQHRDYVEACIAAHKHVVCEKPLATSATEGMRMLEAAADAGIAHATAYCYRYFPMVAKLRQLIRAGELGHVHTVRGAYLNDAIMTLPADHWIFDRDRAGPSLILADIGVHLWDLVEFVTGKAVVEVVAHSATARPTDGGGEDSAVALLRLSDNCLAAITVVGVAPGHGNTLEIEILGGQRAALWRQEDPDRLTLGAVGSESVAQARDIDSGLGLSGSWQLPRGHVQGYFDAFRDLLASFYRALGNHPPLPTYPTFADGVRGLAILEAIVASVERREWVSVPRGPTGEGHR